MNQNLNIRLLYLLFFLIIIGVGKVSAQEETAKVSRPITQIYSFEIGGVSDLDTYLSPLRFSGTSLGISGKWSKVLPWQQNQWGMDFDASFRYGYMKNKPKTALMYDLNLDLAWAATRRFRLKENWLLKVGGALDLRGGALYLPGNGNNPASAKADISLALKAGISKPFKIKNLNILFSDELSLPLFSVFFSPEYGETYYEIYLGNHKGLAHAGWWGNRFYIDNILAFDLDIGPSALRLGYRLTASSGYVNHITTEGLVNSFVIGWIPNGIGLKKPKPAENVEKIISLY